VTRTPAGIADSETSLTADVDMGSDLPLRPFLFEPERDLASILNGEQVGAMGSTRRARLRFLADFGPAARLAAPLRRNSNRGVDRFKRPSWRIASRLTPI
jgi:hypothetical protein